MTTPAKFFWGCIICLITQLLTWHYYEKEGLSLKEAKKKPLSMIVALPGNIGVILSAIWWIFSL